MSSINTNTLVRLGLAVFVTIVAGCADIGMKSDLAPQEVVKSRAQAWADALLAGDLDKAWAFTSPSYRQFSSAKEYSPHVQGSGRWTSAKVDSVQCTEDVCDVSVMVEYHIQTLKMSNRRPLDYKWVLVDGEWWLHVPAK